MCILISVNNIAFPCKICHVNISNKDSAVQCDICQPWVHMKYNKLNHIDYKYLQGSIDPWYCLSCCSKICPFGTLTKTSSLPWQTLSLKVPIVTRIKKVYFH